MSALHEIDASSIAAAAAGTTDANVELPDIPPEIVAAVKGAINRLFWKWYHVHENDVWTHVHFFFFSREIRVKDMGQLFTMLFGNEGQDMSGPADPVTQPAPVS